MVNLETMAQAARAVLKAEADAHGISVSVNDTYQRLMYQGGAEQRGFAVGEEAGAVHNAHGWFSAGVGAAYQAIQARPDVPEDVKRGLASYAGLLHGLKTE